MSRVGQSPIHFSENVQVTKENNIISWYYVYKYDVYTITKSFFVIPYYYIICLRAMKSDTCTVMMCYMSERCRGKRGVKIKNSQKSNKTNLSSTYNKYLKIRER